MRGPEDATRNTPEAGKTDKKQQGFRLRKTASAMLSLLATVGLNAALIKAGAEPKLTTEKASTSHDVEKIREPLSHKPIRVKTIEAYPITHHSDIPADWAMGFAEDVTPESLRQNEIDALVDEIKTISEEHKMSGPIILTMQGHASSEDDTDKAGLQEAGVNVESRANRQTAEARANVLAIAVTQKLNEMGIKHEIRFDEPIEDMLDDEEVEYINALTKKFGYNSTLDMIMRWNRDPDQAPPGVNVALRKLLGDERYVSVTIEAEGTKVAYKCILPVREATIHRVTHQPGSQVTLPIPVFIPVLKRKRQEETAEEEPEQYADTEHVVPQVHMEPTEHADLPGKPPNPHTLDSATEGNIAEATTPEPVPERVTETIVSPADLDEAPTSDESLRNRLERLRREASRDRKIKDKIYSAFMGVIALGAVGLGGKIWETTPVDFGNCYVTIEKDAGALLLTRLDIHWNSCDVPTKGGVPPGGSDDPCGITESIVRVEDKSDLYFVDGKLVSGATLDKGEAQG